MTAILLEKAQAALPYLLVVVIGFLLKRKYAPSIAHIKGPWLASVSTIWQIWHTAKGDIEYAVRREHQKHGDFVRISHNEVSCSHPDSIAAILAPPYRKGEWYQALAVPDKYHQTPMSECDPKRHRERSSITASSYSLSYLIKSESRVDTCIEELRTQMQTLARSNQPFAFDDWLNFVAFDVIGELTFSQRLGFVRTGKDIDNSIGSMRFLMLYQAVMGYMYWLHPLVLHSPFAGYFGLKPHAHIFETVSAAVEKRKGKAGLKNDMVSQWISNHQKWPERMEEREILAVAGMTTIAGSETMTGALASFFYFLLKNPECMERLKGELRSAHRAGQLSPVVQHEEAKQLPYLQACIKESLRYFAPVPFGLPRIAPAEGIKLGDHFFESGTILSVNPFVIQRDRRYFGDDAEVFNPDRWMRPEAASYEKYLITFGTGYNGCPGKQFAYAEIGKVTATLLRDFDFEFDKPDTEWEHRSHFTIAQKNWPVRIRQTEL
ncbi:cytochrome P450 [Aspergillus steynii IBT 23096]|uniref:Cytochrome P450 n=1 Tax=Aspergillus steynii IBT 23096 TaxID=1392250 RepID=A0A2I2FV85_9EURO|nr:cytochrome P450 [Aspergillus steynii IBT 23096]PLB44553.1 cytochrome P450 [Aspergillus steynii IBT 23096]